MYRYFKDRYHIYRYHIYRLEIEWDLLRLDHHKVFFCNTNDNKWYKSTHNIKSFLKEVERQSFKEISEDEAFLELI